MQLLSLSYILSILQTTLSKFDPLIN